MKIKADSAFFQFSKACFNQIWSRTMNPILQCSGSWVSAARGCVDRGSATQISKTSAKFSVSA